MYQPICVPKRRGITAVLAMLFLVLFASLAIGFYAATNTSVIVAHNENSTAKSLLAAETGMDFVRFELSRISIPPNTPSEEVFTHVANHLKQHLESTRNLKPNTVAVTPTTITIPAEAGAYVTLENKGADFRATLELVGEEIRVRTVGRYSPAGSPSGDARLFHRAVQMDYQRQERPSNIFDYAVASRGGVVMRKGSVSATGGAASSIATVMSAREANPAVSVNGGAIGGDLHITAEGLASIGGGSVAGTRDASQILAEHTHVIPMPEFPEIETASFKPYAVNTYRGGSGVLKNVRIPANTNPKFTGGVTIQGILYIEVPNNIEFRGNVNLQGFIVFENKGSSSANSLNMSGNFSHMPLPPGPEFDSLRKIKGIAVLAPTAQMVISGSVDANLIGNVVLGSFANGGSADWTISQGSLITMDRSQDATVFNGKTVKFTSTGKYNLPSAGLLYSSRFWPRSSSYEEVKP
jgi:hypothetical protein